jgi:tetratricopeptide (TPR) repeat protein
LLANILANIYVMKTNKYIAVDLMLLGLTIALMFLFEVVFYPSVSIKPTKFDSSVLTKTSTDLKLLGEEKTPIKINDKIREALNYIQKGDLKTALITCNNAVTIDSTDTKCYFLRAKINTLLNRNTEAIKDYTQTLKLNPKHFQSYMNRGLLCIKEKSLINAMADFYQAARINPFKAIPFLLSKSIKHIFI